MDFEAVSCAWVTFPWSCAANDYLIAIAVTISDATAIADIMRVTKADGGSNCGLKHNFGATRSWRSMGMDHRSIQRKNTSDSATESVRDAL